MSFSVCKRKNLLEKSITSGAKGRVFTSGAFMCLQRVYKAQSSHVLLKCSLGGFKQKHADVKVFPLPASPLLPAFSSLPHLLQPFSQVIQRLNRTLNVEADG